MYRIHWQQLQDVNSLFAPRQRFSSIAQRDDKAFLWPASDVYELNDGYEIHLDLPSVDPSTISVKVADGVLTVSGEKNVSRKGEAEGEWHQRERRYGRFERRFVLPKDTNSEAVRATSKHGELVVAIAKRADLQPKTIQVNVDESSASMAAASS